MREDWGGRGGCEVGRKRRSKSALRSLYPADLFNSALSRIEREIVTGGEKDVNSP